MATAKRMGTEGLSPALLSSLEEQLSKVKIRIADRAYELALSRSVEGAVADEKVQASLGELSQATNEVFGGDQAGRSSFARRFFEYFPPFTCVCTILCLAFAILGLWALSNSQQGDIAKATSSFLDIAKIFAGAIVGSTATSAISASRNRRLSR